mmetsp:Transcript_33492/g.65965  ORF Transcript_33492/g.65965 Transcript_33492/m.65965 type:complete len:223 (-) Transcript_33492:88-756(-)
MKQDESLSELPLGAEANTSCLHGGVHPGSPNADESILPAQGFSKTQALPQQDDPISTTEVATRSEPLSISRLWLAHLTDKLNSMLLSPEVLLDASNISIIDAVPACSAELSTSTNHTTSSITLATMWQTKLTWRQKEEIWRSFVDSPKMGGPHGDEDPDAGEPVYSRWWDWRNLSWGFYFRKEDMDRSIIVDTWIRHEKWLSGNGISVKEKTQSWPMTCALM